MSCRWKRRPRHERWAWRSHAEPAAGRRARRRAGQQREPRPRLRYGRAGTRPVRRADRDGHGRRRGACRGRGRGQRLRAAATRRTWSFGSWPGPSSGWTSARTDSSCAAPMASPQGRGLGSSAAAIIGGIVLARAMVVDGQQRMSDSDVLQLALTMEGHPDNLSASLHGGFTIAWLEADGFGDLVRMMPHPGVRPVVLVPPSTVPTSAARAMLPPSVAFGDAAANVSRAALLVHAMTVDPMRLMPATEDRLHQQARASAYPESVAAGRAPARERCAGGDLRGRTQRAGLRFRRSSTMSSPHRRAAAGRSCGSRSPPRAPARCRCRRWPDHSWRGHLGGPFVRAPARR